MADDAEWQTGLTQSISTTGVLIEADMPVPPATPIVLVISLPPPAGRLFGRGRVVRIVEPTLPTQSLAFAVAVNAYRLDRRNRPNRITP